MHAEKYIPVRTTQHTSTCRVQHATLAEQFKDVPNGDIHCTHAGVSGGDICVDDVPTVEEDFAANYCTQLQTNCPENHAAFTDCEGDMTALLISGDFTFDGKAADTTGNTIQCLTNHALLAGLVDQTLCTDADPNTTTACQ